MKSILISIKPEYVKEILNGNKTIEIRKSMPKCELPCKVYIYCTQGQMLHDMNKESYWNSKRFALANTKSNNVISSMIPFLNGKVVAEFTLKTVNYLIDCGGGIHYADKDYNLLDPYILPSKTQLTEEQICDYLYGGDMTTFAKNGYAWIIDDLVVYDSPKELSEFNIKKEVSFKSGSIHFNTEKSYRIEPIKRPFQSWGYVYEKKN